MAKSALLLPLFAWQWYHWSALLVACELTPNVDLFRMQNSTSLLSEQISLGVLTAIYNLTTGFGIVAAATTFLSKKDAEHSFNFLAAAAGVVAIIQLIAFGIMLIIYRNFLSIAPDYTRDFRRREVIIPESMNSEARAKTQHEIAAERDAVTRKYHWWGAVSNEKSSIKILKELGSNVYTFAKRRL
ncbi:unnamed protein product [Gongylonema pulchrum]|uniref:Solute carrier family 40 protein n=1 Tax=Gongylonema pulchrum TaxID=637853 RepID=A0A183D0J1_9BILA|nr:unnamed protein product [Gongylonema pulchrum]